MELDKTPVVRTKELDETPVVRTKVLDETLEVGVTVTDKKQPMLHFDKLPQARKHNWDV